MAVTAPAVTSVPDGPRAYRYRLRRRGPLAGLVAPVGGLLLAVMVASTQATTGKALLAKGAVVLLGTLCALPTGMLLGVPWLGGGGRYFLAVVTSAGLWIAVGALAGWRATRAPVASWIDWWREYALLAGAVMGAVALALVMEVLVLGGGAVL